MNLSDSDRKAYEAYLLAKTEDEQQEAIKKLIPGSHLFYHLYFLDRLNKVGSKLTDDDKKHYEQFQKKYYSTDEFRQVQARLKLLEYDDAPPEKQNQSLLNVNYQFLHLGFDHYKPEDLQRQNEALSSEDSQSEDLLGGFGVQPNIPSALNYDSYFSKQNILSRMVGIKTDESFSGSRIRTLPIGYEHLIDFTTYHPTSVYNQFACDYKRSNSIADLESPSFYDALKEYFEFAYSTNRHFELNQQFCNSLTIKQMDKIGTLHPKIKDDKIFIGSYFQKQFNEELSEENQEMWSFEEKRSNILTLYNYAKSKNMPKTLQSSLLIEVLDLGIKIGVYDENLFRYYLQMPLTNQQNVFKGTKVAHADTHWNRYIGNVQSQQTKQGSFDSAQNDMINKYLEYFCIQKGSLEAFKEDFEVHFLKEIEERIQIYNSDDMTNLSVDLKKYKTVSSEVIIRFLESNQEQFKVDEEVSLSLELKNIQTLYVKIFEFNTETYYKKTLQPFNTGLNLDGLIASIEKSYEYKNPANKKFIENFKFSELTGKVGLYIVEFIGNGMSARAVIKKGSLSLIHKPTIAGHLAYILDENKKICTGPKTGLYFDNHYYEAHSDKGGKIFIPYGKTSLVSKAIMMNNGFAQLCDFERQTEQYSFSAWIHINTESILIGNKASVIIKPLLYINSRRASVDLLKRTKITLTTLSYIDSIPVTKTFENIKFVNDQELILDFQVPPYLSQISVTLDTEVYSITQQTHQKFNSSRIFKILNYANNHNMTEMFLKKERGEYFLYLLGKNGEPRPRVNVHFDFIHKDLSHIERPNVCLKTDKDGKVSLGKLKKIMGIYVNARLFNITQQFFIDQNYENLTYPAAIDAVDNETLEFPVLFKKKSRKHISLIKKNVQNVLEDLYDQIEFIKQENKDYNLIKINSLSDGVYVLNLKAITKKILITIHKGQYWENDSFILKRNNLFENKKTAKMIKIEGVKVEENKDGTNSVCIKLEDFSQEARVHAFACQYMPNVSTQMFCKVNKMMSDKFSKTIFPFANWKNIFINNRELSDEFRYVFDRKYAERTLGNTLERPRLVLKRTFIQNTQINKEVLRQGTQYQQQSLGVEVQQTAIYKNAAPRSSTTTSMSSVRPIEFGQEDNDQYGYDRLIETLSADNTEVIPELQNFLKNMPLTQFNLKPNERGEVTFNANLHPYTQLFILAVDMNSVAQRRIDLDLNPTQKRDLSLLSPLDVSKGFTESRTTLEVLKHDTHFIEDITSTEIQLIDDMKKVKGVLEELMKQVPSAGGSTTVFKKLEGIFMKWPKMDNEEKNKQYYKHFCHELNIFIYFKDHDYFQSTIKPFLQCKMEKTFIDYYLLEDYDNLFSYNTMDKILTINSLEKCFLIDALMKKEKVEEAQSIAEYLRLKTDATERKEPTEYNRIFDIVLNLNMLKVQPVNLADVSILQPPPPSGGMPPPPSEFRGYPTSGSILPPPPGMPAPFANYANMNQLPMDMLDFGGFGGAGFGSSINNDPLNNRSQLQQQQQFVQAYYIQQQPVQNRAYQQIQQQAMPMMAQNIQPMARRQNIQPMSNAQPISQLSGSINHSAYHPSSDFMGAFDDVSAINDAYNQQRKQPKIQFEEVQTTGEYMETHYYQQTTYAHANSLLPENSFWVDYARFLSTNTDKGRQFLSANFFRNASNQTAALLTFALLDLPFEAESHGYKTNESRGVEIKACGNIILFKKEVREAPLELSNDILVTHRYVHASGGSDQQSIQDEFLTCKPYACEVIMTNVSPQSMSFSLLYQIPQGSLPLQTTKYMKSFPYSLSPYTTNKQIFYFYFPKQGDFSHFPSNISSAESKIISRAASNSLKVVNKLTINRKENFRDILQGGSKEEILEFMKTHNLIKGEKGFSFTYILWLLKDKVFFKKAIEILRKRLIYNDQVWAYGFYHRDDESICKEYILRQKPYEIVQYIGPNFKSKLYQSDNIQMEFKHLDYYPMINARVHTVGELEHWTLNQNFKDTYEKFLRQLIQMKDPLNGNLMYKMMFIYNMQLQDRITDAIQLFKTIDPKSEELIGMLRIQYDYMSAYFDFFIGESDGFKIARSIVRQYEDYPISQWRILFLEILDQLNEYDGEVDESLDIDTEAFTEEQKKQKYKQQARKEPRINCEVSSEQQQLALEIANIKAICIKFYIIDAEILFSRTPFLKENTEEFSYVKPCYVIEKELVNQDLNSSNDTTTYLQQEQKFELGIPEHLRNQNMVIEINGEGKQIFKTYYSTQIKVNLIESFGELKVTDKEGKPLSKVYVKVFAQRIGQSTSNAFFFKDGYTDIRGKFEYASTSGNRLKEVQKFAIFVMSDTLGSTIKECDPPKVSGEASGDSSSPEISGLQAQKEVRLMNRMQHKKAKY